jgi:hypothetical protein
LDIVPVGSIPTNNGYLQTKKNFEASSFEISNPAVWDLNIEEKTIISITIVKESKKKRNFKVFTFEVL